VPIDYLGDTLPAAAWAGQAEKARVKRHPSFRVTSYPEAHVARSVSHGSILPPDMYVD
jgi:hypothetical protein